MTMVENLAELRQVLTERFSDGELRTLAFDLGVPADELTTGGAGKGNLARELVAWCERRERVAELRTAVAQERPSSDVGLPTSGRQRTTGRLAEQQDVKMEAWQGQQLERLVVKMDGMNEAISRVLAQNAALDARVAGIERRLDDMEQRTQPTGQTYLLAGLGLVMTLVLVYALFILTTTR